MKTIDDLLSFVQRLDKTPKRISEILCAVQKYLIPVLEPHETQDLTRLDVKSVTDRVVFSFGSYSQGTLQTYRDRCRYALWKFKRHVEYGDVPLVNREVRVYSKTKVNMLGVATFTVTAHELEVLKEILRRHATGEPVYGDPKA